MQISSLYSNNKELFQSINFNCCEFSSTLNVIYGAVTDAKNLQQDSHNLGKTTLIHVLDFLLLKDITGSQHFFETHKDRFSNLVMYLEVATNASRFVTIRRAVQDPLKIAITTLEDKAFDLCELPDDQWDHVDLNLSTARELLDGLLNITVISPHDYRKALTYFLRTQSDYLDVLQLQKFQAGQHLYWKPFVMTLIGFDEKPVSEKYMVDKNIEALEEKKKNKEAEIQVSEREAPRLAAEISNLKTRLESTETELDSFEFTHQERRMMHELVDEIEVRVSEINEDLYNINVDIKNIDRSLSKKIQFKVDEIEEIFEEANLHFPHQIKKSYEELISFNKSLTKERNNTLRRRKKSLLEEREILREELLTEDKKRSEYNSILKNSDSLEKFKFLQKNLTEQKAELTYLEGQYERLIALANVDTEINRLKRQRGEVIERIQKQLSNDSKPRKNIAKFFNDFCTKVLDHEGLFYLEQNTVGNVEFKVVLKEPKTSRTSRQSDGKSYKQLLCALFDLALLKAYQDAPFYHFVYHDGILEGLDDRKKGLFLEVVQEVVNLGKVQYILSVIDSDIPRDINGHRVEFENDEIVLRLHDGGDNGRLFRMAEF